MKNDNESGSVRWNEWSDDAFNHARNEGKLVLLDLSATWCHWCHEMDRNTYDNPEIAKIINDKFVPVRVDIDMRPDISERYNRGGFPTTAFLSDRGESVWGATYVPPADMKRIMESILKAKETGEIDRALERFRAQPLSVLRNARARVPADTEQLSGMFEEMFSAYDVEYGGFGVEPKFPHPDVLEILLVKYAETRDEELADAVINTIEQMASGLHDKVEGGVFRYSVTRNWQTPHYEKMLDTNLGFLRNLLQAFGVVGNHGFDILARDIAKYVMTRLRDSKSGGFYGSQDADEEYYKLPASERRKRKAPSIDKTVYAGWNAEASAVLSQAGIVLDDEEMLSQGKSSWAYALEHLWNSRLGLVRHLESSEIYLFEDQVSFFKALLTQLGLSKDDDTIRLAEQLIRGVNEAFASTDGGFNDVMKSGEKIGELDTPRRPLIENSNWALALAQFGSLVHRQELIDQARNILNSYAWPEVEAHGVFAAAYLRARWALDNGIAVAEIHAMTEEHSLRCGLQSSARMLFDPSIVQMTIIDKGLREPYAVVCTDKGCSKKINDPDELLTFLKIIVEGRKPQQDAPDGMHARAGFRID